jgi:ribonuclease HI
MYCETTIYVFFSSYIYIFAKIKLKLILFLYVTFISFMYWKLIPRPPPIKSSGSVPVQNDRDSATRAGGSDCNRENKLWRILWQLDIKNVEKHLIWGACHDSFLTKVNLCSRRIIMDPLCPLCEQEPESTYHILWECPSARDVWSAGCPVFQKRSCGGPTFMRVLEELYEICDSSDFCLFIKIARRTWLRRNGFVHEGTFIHPNILVKQAQQEVELLKSLRDEDKKHRSDSPGNPLRSAWQAPPQGWYKANWDASVDRKKGRVGLGVIIRDHNGAMWVARSQTRHGFLDPTAAEAWAALLAVQISRDLGICQIQLEGDAKNVVAAVNADGTDESGWGQITEDIRFSLQSIPRWEMGYSRRDTNKVAHVLANLAVSVDMNMVWLYSPPDCIHELLQANFPALRIS